MLLPPPKKTSQQPTLLLTQNNPLIFLQDGEELVLSSLVSGWLSISFSTPHWESEALAHVQ